tara:strand:+ start:649 stop:1164 length:516 start_codon:yes stop_codon:yes gene_type:complete
MEDDMSDDDKPKLTLVSDQSESEKSETKSKRRPLTAKQERFLAEMIKGATQADAYRAAYDAKGMKPSAIYTEASLLASHPEITRRLLAHEASVERAALSSALTRRRWIVERLEHEAAHAESDAARVRALELLGKDSSVRMWTDVVETVEAETSPDEVRAQLEARLTALLAK